MTTVLINNKPHIIPTSWDDLKLKDYLNIRSLENKKDSMDFVTYVTTYMNTITGIPMEDLDTITPDEFKLIMSYLNDLSDINKVLSDNLIWEHNGITYAFDLNIDNLKQRLDIESTLKGNDFWDVAHKITAMFIRPLSNSNSAMLIGKKFIKKQIDLNDVTVIPYDSDGIEARAEIFYNHMPMTIIYNMAIIFLSAREN